LLGLGALACIVFAGPLSTARADDKKADSKYKFEVYEGKGDKAGQYFWRLKDAEGKTVAMAGEGQKDRTGAATTINQLQNKLASFKFETYEDADKSFNWRLLNSAGKVVAKGGGGFKDRAAAEKGIEFVKGAKDAQVVEGRPS